MSIYKKLCTLLYIISVHKMSSTPFGWLGMALKRFGFEPDCTVVFDINHTIPTT